MFRIQSDDFVIFGFYCVAFIEPMSAGKTLLDHTNLFFPNDNQKNGKIIYKYFDNKCVKRKHNPRF